MFMFNLWTQQEYLPIWSTDQSLFYNLFPKHLSLQSFPRSLHTSSRTTFSLICTASIQSSQVLWHYSTPEHPALTTGCCRIGFESLVLVYCGEYGTGWSYNQGIVKPCTWTRPLRSKTAKWLATPSLRGDPSCCSTTSWLFAVLAQQWWNEPPRTAGALPIFRRSLKTHLFRLHLGRWMENDLCFLSCSH